MNRDSVEHHWGLKNTVMGEILQNTGGRTTQRFSSDEGEYVYKIAGNNKTPAVLEKELKVFDILNKRGYSHISKLVKTKEGKLFATIDNKNIFVLEYIEGVKPESNPENWARLGKLTAELHTIKDFPFKTDFDPAKIIKENFPEIAAGIPFGSEYLLLAKDLRDFSTLSKSLIHTDIGCHNTIETKERNLVLIDWDDTGLGPSVLDIGFPLIVQFYNEDGDFAEENAKSFYQSYFENREISNEEKEYIFDAGLFIAMNYLPHGNIEKRWRVIQKVANDKEKIIAWIKSL